MTVLWRVDLFAWKLCPFIKSPSEVMSTNLDSPAACCLYPELFDAAEAAATIFFGAGTFCASMLLKRGLGLKLVAKRNSPGDMTIRK